MTTYHKIPGPFKREDKKPHRLLVGTWTQPEFEYLYDCPWRWTEKIDGTNVRVIWDGHKVTFGGRSDRAQLPKPLEAYLTDTFLAKGVEEVFEQTFGEDEAVLYGEGFGAGIQKGGGNYGAEQRLILFDVKVGDWWLQSEDVSDVAHKFDLPVVPEQMNFWSLGEMIQEVQWGRTSHFGDFEAEGFVGTPLVPLFTRQGKRVIVKVKAADFSKKLES
jgi:hypothetical protein